MRVPLITVVTSGLLISLACAVQEHTADVAIVGGGLSGLTAAKHLKQAGKSVMVLEARGRVGGRVQNRNLTNGGVTELGAAFVGPTQNHVLALAQELGLKPFTEYNNGSNVYFANGKVKRYPAKGLGIPPVSTHALIELSKVQTKVDNLARKIDVNKPWSSPNAQALDQMTFATFAYNITKSETAKAIINVAVEAIFSAEPDELSLLYVLAYVAAAGDEKHVGNFERLISTGMGAQKQRIVGGTGLIPERLAARLGSSRVLLNAPVSSIVKTGESTYTVTAEGHVVHAKSVVVAMSPPLAARIDYQPKLPAMRDQLTQRMFMGALGKAIAIYETPFWRKDRLSGQALSTSGATRATFDVSDPKGSYGAMLGFLEADEMRELDPKSNKEIEERVKKDYINYFGPQAAHVKEWVIKRWDNNIYSRGGPVALAGPGTLTEYGPALRKSFDGIHFAGTESSPYWTGYMDGAIRSGERVASEILGTL